MIRVRHLNFAFSPCRKDRIYGERTNSVLVFPKVQITKVCRIYVESINSVMALIEVTVTFRF